MLKLSPAEISRAFLITVIPNLLLVWIILETLLHSAHCLQQYLHLRYYIMCKQVLVLFYSPVRAKTETSGTCYHFRECF